MGRQHNKEYAEKLERAGIEALRIGAIWPTPEVKPEKLGTKGMSGEGIEQLARQLSKVDTKLKSPPTPVQFRLLKSPEGTQPQHPASSV